MDLRRCDPGLEALGLPVEVRRQLHRQGIVTCSQLWEILGSREEPVALRSLLRCAAARGAGQVDTGTIRQACARVLPDGLQHRLASWEWVPPSRWGVREPTGDLGMRRMRTFLATDRHDLARRVARLRLKTVLPTRMLLHEWVPQVGNQGRLGSCTGWGSTASREFLSGEQHAPLFAYALAKHLDGRPDVEGSWQYYCFLGFARHGHLLERDYPYSDTPSDLLVEPWLERAAPYRIDGFADFLLERDDRARQAWMMKAILAGRLSEDLGPQTISISVAVHDSWRSATTGRYGLVRLPLPGEPLLGGHAMCVVGYVEGKDPDGLYDTDYFILRNSWGEEWAAENPLGLPGHALVPAAFFNQPDLLWEAYVCLAEDSPLRKGSLLARLFSGWRDERLLADLAVGTGA